MNELSCPGSQAILVSVTAHIFMSQPRWVPGLYCLAGYSVVPAQKSGLPEMAIRYTGIKKRARRLRALQKTRDYLFGLN